MIKFSYQNHISGETHLCDRESFNALIDSVRVNNICNEIYALKMQMKTCTDDAQKEAIQKKIGEKKRQLPAILWHASWPDGEKRKNIHLATASDLTMIDIDHNPHPEEEYARIENSAKAMGMVAAHISPSTEGLRLIMLKPKGLSIADSQKFFAEKLGLEGVDFVCHEINRISFVTPRRYWRFIAYDILFGDSKPTPVDATGYIPPEMVQPPFMEETVQKNEGCVKQESGVMAQETFPTEYDGVSYKAIVDAMIEIHAQPIVHGVRNTTIYRLASMLRYITDNNPLWISQILPDFGEERGRYLATVRSACQTNQSTTWPQMLVEAIALAKKKCGVGRSETDAEQANEESMPPEMPKKLPHPLDLLVSCVPAVCKPNVARAVFPALATHLKGVFYRQLDNTLRECACMHLTIAPQSSGKSSVNKLNEYIMQDITDTDAINRQREQEWRTLVNSRAHSKDKPERPKGLCIRNLTSDMTAAAFTMRLREADGFFIYSGLPELEMLKNLRTNGCDISKLICAAFDCETWGQERCAANSEVAYTKIHYNFCAASTEDRAYDFFRNSLTDGCLTRISISSIVPDDKPFVYKDYPQDFAEKLKPYITALTNATGVVECKPARNLMQRLQKEIQAHADQCDDPVYREFGRRALTIAHSQGIMLYIMNGYRWNSSIADFVEWSLKTDLHWKDRLFGDEIREARANSRIMKKRRGSTNLLEKLPDSFSVSDAEQARVKAGMSIENGVTKQMLANWVFRRYIEFIADTKKYNKTDRYKRKK